MKKQIKGKRFTKVEIQEFSLDDLTGKPFPTVMKEIKRARQVAENILVNSGLPTDAKITWTRADGVEMHGFLDTYIAELYDQDSPEWYAAKIVMACHRLENAAGKQAVELAFQIGQWTAYARVYQMLDCDSAKGGRKSNRKTWADELAKKLCHLSNDEIAWQLIDNEDIQIKADGIRYDILVEEDPENLTRDTIVAIPLDPEKHKQTLRINSFMRRYIQPARKNSK